MGEQFPIMLAAWSTDAKRQSMLVAKHCLQPHLLDCGCVTKTNTYSAACIDDFAACLHESKLVDGFFDAHIPHLILLVADHAPEFTLLNQANGHGTKSNSENPVQCCG
jgi:hypothetical protein